MEDVHVMSSIFYVPDSEASKHLVTPFLHEFFHHKRH